MIKYAIDQHAVAFPSKVLASNGGKHIYNITLTEDVDNGWFIGKKQAWEELDRYEEAAPTSISGVVQGKAANGNYYVEITAEPVNAYFVYQVPMIEEEYNKAFQKESNFYNAGPRTMTNGVAVPGDTVRAYELAVGDVIEISADGFSTEPSKADGTVTVTLQAIAGKTAMQLGE